MVTIIRWSQPLNMLSKERDTFRSEGEKPSRSTLVESHSRANTPLLPKAPNRARSIMLPEIGVESILKSPVMTTTPTGV